MHLLQGFRTIIFNLVAIAASWFGCNCGIEIPQEHQAEVTTTVIALGNIALRLLTKTPIGKNGKK